MLNNVKGLQQLNGFLLPLNFSSSYKQGDYLTLLLRAPVYPAFFLLRTGFDGILF